MNAVNYISEARSFLLVTETPYSKEVCADRMRQDLRTMRDDLGGIWLISREGIKSVDYATTGMEDEDGLLASSFDHTHRSGSA